MVEWCKVGKYVRVLDGGEKWWVKYGKKANI